MANVHLERAFVSVPGRRGKEGGGPLIWDQMFPHDNKQLR